MHSFWSTNKNTSGRRVCVGLSGGVDSAASAALLQQEGYDVVGVFIRISIPGYPCTAGEDKIDAMRVAAHLKIPFFEIDLSEAYKQKVFDASLNEFKRGRTPNPDALCNREIKFGLLYDWCMERGADFVATGHYAQVKDGLLFAGRDESKDQSYFLWMVPQDHLLKTLFPIGHLHKSEVRKLAEQFNLPNAQRKDSQGLCFLGPISIEDMLTKELSTQVGDVLNEEGHVVGSHKGVALYTLGQRHGFELFAHTPNTPPHYVVGKDTERNTLTVSINKFPMGASHTVITLSDTNWIGEATSEQVSARYRYHQPLIHAQKNKNITTLDEPHYVPEGQSLVLYQHDRCLGGGIIDKSTIH